MVFGIRRPNDETMWVEIGALPLLDIPGVDGIVLRLQAWDAQHHFDTFLVALLADEPLHDVLVALSRSIAASLEADGAAVHHGFDGTTFAGAAGCGVPLDSERHSPYLGSATWHFSPRPPRDASRSKHSMKGKRSRCSHASSEAR